MLMSCSGTSHKELVLYLEVVLVMAHELFTHKGNEKKMWRERINNNEEIN